MTFDVSKVKSGELASDFAIKQEDFKGSYGKIQLKNGTEVDFEVGLKKDETEQILLEIDEDGNDSVTDDEINSFSGRYNMEADDVQSIVQQSLTSIDSDNESADSDFKTVIVDAWKQGDNDCLDHIMKNHYSDVTPYSKEWFELEKSIMDANPEIYGTVDADGNETIGRKRILDGTRHNSVISPGDEIKLPNLALNKGADADNLSEELLEIAGLDLNAEECALLTSSGNFTLKDGRTVGMVGSDYIEIIKKNDDGTKYIENIMQNTDMDEIVKITHSVDTSMKANDAKAVKYDLDGNIILEQDMDNANKFLDIIGHKLDLNQFTKMYTSEANDILTDDGLRIKTNGKDNFVVISADGKNIKNIYTDTDGYTIDEKNIQSDDNITIEKTKYNTNNVILGKTTWFYETEDAIKNNKATKRQEDEYDENGKLIGTKIYDANGNII